ncbi:Uracil-DNA glycosylase [Mucilaginibacter lappiensis]|uniref:Uracil-DNA glycosylase n=1 Tax=Mucilaginibacter lappiensis TaxID=354630 RepID=A0ABR6PN31_9SPHI|nr:uracil-DNA glycosylase [Mucilaginibacter lappiensis]MBB6111173.1 uracil-DNA glycosylase [Mucilaginibacter lappiensis]SIR70782.1 Uracil-DNA glycosylase [Mucilaginibacter lappiensis]
MANALDPSWMDVLKDEFGKDYMIKLKDFLQKEKAAGQVVYPKNSEIFNAFNTTHFDDVKVVILGQDPYHGAHQAHGLSFSVQKGIATPRSLINIYKELQTDIPGFKIPAHGNLEDWAKQGVLLLNATLTVRASSPGSHQKQGWEEFTDEVIKTISDKKAGIVFILWGAFAQSKATLINEKKHFILKSPHPSPFSADRGFFGSKPFSKTNEILRREGKAEINWQIS